MAKILDCTLRDGGYYTNWKFDDHLVFKYLHAMELSFIDYVELGFRFVSNNKKIGKYGISSDTFLDNLSLPDSIKYSVMINAKDFLSDDLQKTDKLINELFLDSSQSKISLIRVAINFDDALKVTFILEKLKKLGYEVGLNLMQSHNKEQSIYTNFFSQIKSWKLVDILYFADSFGNMVPDDVKNIIHLLKSNWNGLAGFHSHNNKGYALINSMTAIQEGVDFCDSTVTGMGRGAGNVPTESLLMELVDKGLRKSNLTFLQGIVADFMKLKKNYGWGTNMNYQFAANNNIHPTFVQTLSDDSRYDQFQSFQILEYLALQKNSSEFNYDSIRNTIYKENASKEGSWNPEGFLNNKEVLLVGGGISVKKNKDKILKYINLSKPHVIFININNYLPQNLGVATIVSHEIRAFLDASFYKFLNHPLIIPMKGLGKLLKDQLKDVQIYDYGLNLQEGVFKIGNNSATLNNSLSAAYALAICTKAGAKKINLVGFDGYQKDDIRFQEMSEVINSYKKLDEAINLVSLTPTLYIIEKNLL